MDFIVLISLFLTFLISIGASLLAMLAVSTIRIRSDELAKFIAGPVHVKTAYVAES